MFIESKRHWFTNKTSTGLWIVDKVNFCYSLEDVARADGVKIPGITAIPAGEYDLIIDDSTRFKRPMPHILAVPRFDGVRIHWGNKDVETDGCPLLGFKRDPKFYPDQVLDSKRAFDKFFALLDAALKSGEKARIKITNEQL